MGRQWCRARVIGKTIWPLHCAKEAGGRVKWGSKSIESLARGLQVLQVLQEVRAASLHDLHLATGIPKPTLIRILHTSPAPDWSGSAWSTAPSCPATPSGGSNRTRTPGWSRSPGPCSTTSPPDCSGPRSSPSPAWWNAGDQQLAHLLRRPATGEAARYRVDVLVGLRPGIPRVLQPAGVRCRHRPVAAQGRARARAGGRRRRAAAAGSRAPASAALRGARARFRWRLLARPRSRSTTDVSGRAAPGRAGGGRDQPDLAQGHRRPPGPPRRSARRRRDGRGARSCRGAGRRLTAHRFSGTPDAGITRPWFRWSSSTSTRCCSAATRRPCSCTGDCARPAADSGSCCSRPAAAVGALLPQVRPLTARVMTRSRSAVPADGDVEAAAAAYRDALQVRKPEAAIADAIACVRRTGRPASVVVVATGCEETLARGFLAAIGLGDLDVVGSTGALRPPRVARSMGGRRSRVLTDRGYPPPGRRPTATRLGPPCSPAPGGRCSSSATRRPAGGPHVGHIGGARAWR